MAKTGNSYLRSAAYKMAVVGTQHNPVMGHCMSKALAIVWGVWRSGRDFDRALRGPRA
jgi:hypothetical protein